MRFRPSAALAAALLAVSITAASAIQRPRLVQATPPPNATQPPLPREATITAVRGTEVTLGIGSDDGARPGAVYGVVHNGTVQARLRIIAVRRTESTATLFDKAEDFVVAVGDAAQFIAVQPLPATPVTPVTRLPVTPTPVTPVVPLNPPLTPLPPSLPVTPTPVTPATGAGGAELSMASISALEGTAVSINAGTDQAVRTGSTVPVLRQGNVIGLIRIQTATPGTSTGTVIWRDEAAGNLIVGDTVGLLPGNTGTGLPPTGPSGAAPSTGVETPNLPAVRIRYETGASNAVVPHSDLTYQYLAELATNKLITRYPPNVFYDDGVRFHRTEEDINFTRAQIADLIREALNSSKAPHSSSKSSVALAYLTRAYAPELRQLGVAADSLAKFARHTGLIVGYSGQSRASLVGGTTNGVIDPFSERYGGRRSRSGFDSQTNVYAQSGANLNLFAMVNTGSNQRRAGTNESSFQIRRALLTYQADRWLKGLTVQVGRNEVWWGPGHFGTLLLSDAAGPLNQILTTFKRGSYRLQSLYAPLDNGLLGASRSLYGHNLDIQLGSQSHLGIAETLLLPTARLDALSFASAFSPFPLFTTERLRHRNTAPSNGNALVQTYLETSLARGLQGYGEFLADDIGINQNNLVRNRLGTLLGAHLFTAGDPARAGLYAEYANLQGRTYLGLRAFNDSDYYYHGRPLGYAVAPVRGPGLGGAESLRLDSYWRATPKLRLGLGVELADLQSEQPISTGARSRQQTYRLRAAYDLSQSLTLVGRLQRVATSQPNLIAGERPVSQRLLQLEIVHAF